MNILFITEKFPYPLDTGGNVRSYHLLRALADRHDVTLAATDDGAVLPAHVEHLRHFCRSVELARVGQWTAWQDAGVLARSLFSSDPVVITRRYRKELAVLIRELAARTAFDAVYLNHLDTAVYVRDLPAAILKILDEHNVVTNQVQSMAAAEENFLRRTVLRRDVRRVARFEGRVANAVDLCLTCSVPDAAALQDLGGSARIVVVPNGVDTDFFRPDEGRNATAGSPTAIFVGTLDYDPCERAVWHFCNTILPHIRKVRPELRFMVVGRNPSARLIALAERDPLVVITGRVEDVRPCMATAQVCVVPLLSGSGTRLKILEAMAAGVPVVSTAIGAEGIEAASGQHLWIVDDPREFAGRVLQLLDQPVAARQMRTAARQLVAERYSWGALAPALLRNIDALGAAMSTA